MDLGFLSEYTVPVIVGICLCVGFIIKSLEFFPNKYIPLVMGILGLVLNIFINNDFTADIMLGGLFSGLASTGLYELFKQLITKGE